MVECALCVLVSNTKVQIKKTHAHTKPLGHNFNPGEGHLTMSIQKKCLTIFVVVIIMQFY